MNVFKQRIFWITVLCFGTTVDALSADVFTTDTVSANEMNTNRQSVLHEIYKLSLKEDNPLSGQDAQYLRNHQTILEDYLMQRLVYGQPKGLSKLLAIYATMPNRDPSLIIWGEALDAMVQGNFQEAINKYRKLISDFPKLFPIRLQLAIALFNDRQYIAAKNEFEKLTSVDQAEIKEIAQSYIDAINSLDSIDFNLGASYVSNDNINDVVPKGTKVTIQDTELTSSVDQEAAHGISFNIGVDGQKILSDRNYLEYGADVSSQLYFDNKKFNQVTASASVGLGYRKAFTDISVAATFENRWWGQGTGGDGNGMKQYRSSPGLTLNLDQRLNDKWRYFGFISANYDRYIPKYDNSTGSKFTLGNTFSYNHSPNQAFYFGGYLTRKNAKSASNAYTQGKLRVGWIQEWPKGFSSDIALAYTRKNIDGKFLGILEQKNNTWEATLSLWHRNIHFAGITPRVVLSANKTYSTNPFNRTSGNNINLDFRKSF